MKTHIYHQKHRAFRKGFNLVELLVVIAIIAALGAVAFTMTSRMKKNANESLTMSNMRQLGIATLGSVSDKGHFPHRNNGPRWDRFILPALGYNGDLAEKGEINRETAPELEELARIFVSPMDPNAKIKQTNYKCSYNIPIWTCNVFGAIFPGAEGDMGVRFGMINRPDNVAMIVQDHKPLNALGRINGFANQATPLDQFGATQLVVFADGHIRKLTTRMSENEFREKHEPGKPKNKVGN